jgi:MFS family permease
MNLSVSEGIVHDAGTQRWPLAVSAAILGWVLDAFDFFVIIFLFETLALNFHVTKRAIVSTLMFTLAMRPVGALLFGSLADRFGRKAPLIACVAFLSGITILSGFSANYAFFLRKHSTTPARSALWTYASWLSLRLFVAGNCDAGTVASSSDGAPYSSGARKLRY